VGEAVRLMIYRVAPYAVNHQRWFFTGDSSRINVYNSKGMFGEGYSRIDAGIAMCHIWLAADHLGKRAEALIDPEGQKNAPSGRSCVASMSII